MFKKLFVFTGLSLCAAVSAFSVELTDYEIPESLSTNFYLNGAFSFNDGNQPHSSYNGFVSTDYNRRYSSIPRVWTLRADGSYEFDRGKEIHDSLEDGYNLFVSTFLDNYYRDTRFFGYGGGDFGYRKNLGADDAADPYTHIQLGAGFGRVYDATPLAQAFRIVDDLLSYGVIDHDLSDDAYLKLAHIIDAEDIYESEYSLSEYKKYWYEDMEAVFIEDGALTASDLGALGAIRIEEILEEEQFSTRNHGWLVRAGVGYLLSDYSSDTDTDPTLTAAFEYYLPISYKFQFNEIAQYTTVLSDDPMHNISNTFLLSYELSNRIDWENSYILALTLPTKDDLEDEISNSFSSGFYYYLTNSVSASAIFSLTHFEDNLDNNGNDDVETKIYIGVRYRLF